MHIVSFDFDWTLCFPDGEPYHPMVRLARWLARRPGRSVYIVTSRADSRHNLEYIQKFLGEQGIQGVRGIRFTDGNLKAPTLLSLGVQHHFDDDPDEIVSATDMGVITHEVWSAEHDRQWESYLRNS